MATFANVSHAANRLLQGRAAKPVCVSVSLSVSVSVSVSVSASVCV
jgi:hypothetical protein